MMKRKKHIYLLTGVMILFPHFIWSQDFTAGDLITLQINDYCLIDTNHAPISLTLGGNIAGAAVTGVSNSDMFLRLSSLVPGGTNREVTVRISSGSVPLGTKLSVVAAPCTIANSGGSLGSVISTPIILSTINQNLILTIGSCYTGTGYNDGYQLTYNWIPTSVKADYALIEATTSPINITVVFTITAHNGN